MQPSLYANSSQLLQLKSNLAQQSKEIYEQQMMTAACLFYQEIQLVSNESENIMRMEIGFDENEDFYVRVQDEPSFEQTDHLTNIASTFFPATFYKNNNRMRNVAFQADLPGLDKMLVFLLGDIEAKVLKATSLQQKMEDELPQQDHNLKKMKV